MAKKERFMGPSVAPLKASVMVPAVIEGAVSSEEESVKRETLSGYSPDSVSVCSRNLADVKNASSVTRKRVLFKTQRASQTLPLRLLFHQVSANPAFVAAFRLSMSQIPRVYTFQHPRVVWDSLRWAIRILD